MGRFYWKINVKMGDRVLRKASLMWLHIQPTTMLEQTLFKNIFPSEHVFKLRERIARETEIEENTFLIQPTLTVCGSPFCEFTHSLKFT